MNEQTQILFFKKTYLKHFMKKSILFQSFCKKKILFQTFNEKFDFILAVRISKEDGKSVLCFKCPYCPHVSNFSANIKRHILTHTQERPFVCGICKKSFNQKITLKNHLIRVHMSPVS